MLNLNCCLQCLTQFKVQPQSSLMSRAWARLGKPRACIGFGPPWQGWVSLRFVSTITSTPLCTLGEPTGSHSTLLAVEPNAEQGSVAVTLEETTGDGDADRMVPISGGDAPEESQGSASTKEETETSAATRVPLKLPGGEDGNNSQLGPAWNPIARTSPAPEWEPCIHKMMVTRRQGTHWCRSST